GSRGGGAHRGLARAPRGGGAFFGGGGGLRLPGKTPGASWAGVFFFLQIFQTPLLCFVAPPPGGAGRPRRRLLVGRAGRSGQAVTRGALRGRWSRPLRAVGGFLLRPWVSVALFSIMMVAWHVPALFDLAARNEAVHIWLMHGTYFAAGVLFWLQFIPSPPFLRRMPLASQAVALIAANAVMWVLAMSMSILTGVSWYSVYGHVPGVTLPPFADQQIGAAILWVCGDFWAIPALIVVVRHMIEQDGSMGAALDKILSRASHGSGRLGWAGGATGWASGSRRPPVTPPEPPAGL